jgi:hypothetical protein
MWQNSLKRKIMAHRTLGFPSVDGQEPESMPARVMRGQTYLNVLMLLMLLAQHSNTSVGRQCRGTAAVNSDR